MINDFLKDKPFLYWNKRGKATIIKDNREARELVAKGSLWGIKCDEDTNPGQYNPIYDIGDGKTPEPPSTVITVPSTHKLIDILEGFEM
jgi:hypothetical protein